MARVEKTVFVSYRRTNGPWALAILQNLTYSGFDVFMDYSGMASGDFESIILENIRAHAHFLVLLTPSALERCSEPGDWLRREIESAIDCRRNIVPLMLEGFDFSSPAIAGQLTGKLATLRKYNAITVSVEYFDAAMDKLKNKFLNVALEAVIQPASPVAAQAASNAKFAAAQAPAVTQTQLTAQQWFERGCGSSDPAEAQDFYTHALELQPDFVEAYNNRAMVRHNLGDLQGALEDSTEAILLNPQEALAFLNRGRTLRVLGDHGAAIQDLTQGLSLKPDDAEAFNERGIARRDGGDLLGAMADYDQALDLKPDLTMALNNRGNLRRTQGELGGAIADFTEAIRLKPSNPIYYYGRGVTLAANSDFSGALADLDEAIRLKPNYELAINNRDAVLKALAARSKP